MRSGYLERSELLLTYHVLVGRYWDGVTSKVNASHAKHDPTPSATPTSPTMRTDASGWDNWTPQKIRERKACAMPVDESDSDDGGDGAEQEAASEIERIDRELQIMRTVFAKWARTAKVHSRVAEELKEGEFEVDWTKAIAPRVEGRIVCVGGEQE